MLEQCLNAENSTKMGEFMTPWPSLHGIMSTHSLDFWNNNINWGKIDGICGFWCGIGRKTEGNGGNRGWIQTRSYLFKLNSSTEQSITTQEIVSKN
jgi:hypothetical protein